MTDLPNSIVAVLTRQNEAPIGQIRVLTLHEYGELRGIHYTTKAERAREPEVLATGLRDDYMKTLRNKNGLTRPHDPFRLESGFPGVWTGQSKETG